MVLSVVKKYVKIYWALVRFSIADAIEYRIDFVLGIIVDLGYNLIWVIFFWVIFGNIKEIVGWSFAEILFFNGIVIIISQLEMTMSYVNSLWRLPAKILKGELDYVLLKPASKQFLLTIGSPYLAGLIGLIPGIYLIYVAIGMGDFSFTTLQLIQGVILMVCGLAVQYGLRVVMFSFSFIVDNREAIKSFSNSVLSYRTNPDVVYQGLIRRIFLVLIPVTIMGSIPTRAFINGFDMPIFMIFILVTVLFFSFSSLLWQYMIKFYSSASS